jgi:hypothetical protein
VIALLWWILSGAEGRLGDRNELLEERGREAAKARHGVESVLAPPAGMPLTEAFETVRVSFPEGDVRARLGGPVILSLRGNRVVFRRRALGEAAFLRQILTEDRRQEIMQRARDLPVAPPSGPGGFALVLSDGKSTTSKSASESDAASLLSLAEGQGGAWTPPALKLLLEEVIDPPPGLTTRPWPSQSGLPDLVALTKESHEIRGTIETRSKLLAFLSSDPLITEGGRTFRIASWSAVLP